MQRDGIICQQNRIGHLLTPVFNGKRLCFIIRKDCKPIYEPAYKLFYKVFAHKDDIPKEFDTRDCEVYPANGFPRDFSIDNLEVVTKKDVLNIVTMDDISDIFKIWYTRNHNITPKTIANKYNLTENQVRFILDRFGRNRRHLK